MSNSNIGGGGIPPQSQEQIKQNGGISGPSSATTSPTTNNNNLTSSGSSNPIPHSISASSLSTITGGEIKIKEKDLSKAKKKLAVFIDTQVEPVKRFKSLVSFISHSDDADIDKVFKDNSYQIYQILLTTFSTYELGTFKQGKHHYAEKEIHKLMELLKRILIHLEGFVRKGWQVKSILNILEKMLGIENIPTIRQSAFLVLLRFLEVMEKPDRYKVDLFASIIDYTPFTPDYTYKINFAKKVFSGNEARRFIVIQATDPPTREDSCRLFETIFIYMNSHMHLFGFWFELLKSQYFTVLYPSICKKIGILAPNDNTGFGTHCPHELQVIIINYLSQWMASLTSKEYLLNNSPEPPASPASAGSVAGASNGDSFLTLSPSSAATTSQPSSPTTAAVATSSPSTQQLLSTSTPGNGRIAIILEIFKQSCKLPLKYSEVIKKSISTFHSLFLINGDLENIFGDEFYTYQTFILQEMIAVFELEATNYEKERESIGMFVIGVFKQMIENYQQMRPRSKEILLTAMLQATTILLRKSNPNKSVSSNLEQAMVSTTLFAWMKSKETSKSMWGQLHYHFEDLFFRVEVVKQVKSKLLQLSLILKDIVYPLTEKKILKKRKDIKSAEKGGEPKSPDTRPNPIDIPIDQTLQSVQWDSESCLTTWHFMLDMLRNCHRIKDANIHELAVSILVDIVDIYLRAEQEIEFSTTLKDTTPPPLSLINIFGARLFDTLSLDSKFIKGKVLAVECLCRLFCRHHPQYPLSILTHFYNHISQTFNYPSVNGIDLSYSIILNSSNIFNLSMPGANVLIPNYLSVIKSHLMALKNPNEICPPADVRKKGLIILGSLIFYPNQFPSLVIKTDVDNDTTPSRKSPNSKDQITMSDLKKEILELLVMTLKSEKVVENKLICLWALSVQAMEEFSASTIGLGNVDLANEAIEAIISHTLHTDNTVSRTSLDAIASLSLSFSNMSKVTANHIMSSLCLSILKGITEMEFGNTSINEQTISNHFHCLLEWISMDTSVFDDDKFREFRSLLFQAIECALGQKGELWSPSNPLGNSGSGAAAGISAAGIVASGNGVSPTSPTAMGSSPSTFPSAGSSPSTSEDFKEHLKAMGKVATMTKKTANIVTGIGSTVSGVGGSGGSSLNVSKKKDAETPQPTTTSEEDPLTLHTKPSSIKDSAETLLYHCLNYVHNFPSKEGSEIITSMVEESDDIEVPVASSAPIEEESSALPLYTVLNDNAIISIVEVPKPNGQGNYARLFIRDATGKYVWNFDHDTINQQLLSNIPALDLMKLYNDNGGTFSPIVVDNVNYTFENNISSNLPVKNTENDDKLKGILDKLSLVPECLIGDSNSLNQPLLNLKPNLIQEFTRIQTELELFIQQEKGASVDTYKMPPQGQSWTMMKPPRAPSVVAQSSRLLLSYLNLLNMNVFVPTVHQPSTSVKQLENNQKLQRALQQLDITPVREILKIGLIYVREGQDDQRDILHNDSTSITPLYKEFVDGLGWPVDLQTHRGYMGGLDRKRSTGTHAPYYSTPTVETIFHNTAAMPTNLADPQQIHKKRHVGNDIVNIIWSEHVRDYSPTTITSQFNDAHIVVYPLPNGLFRVSIYRKENKVPLFGPLVHGMAVSKRLLSQLVRQTSINAYRYVRNATPNYSKPYVLRKSRIREIVARYQSDRSYVDYVHLIASGYNQITNNTSNQDKDKDNNNNTI